MENSVESYIGAQPEQAMDFNQFYNDYGREKYGSHWVSMDPDHWWTKFGSFFTGDVETARNKYDAYLRNLSDRNEFIAQQSARGFDKMMDDTKTQRLMKDYQAAGLNPYLLISNGGLSASSAPSAAKASYSSDGRNKKEASSGKGKEIALTLLAVAKLAALLL